jgi:opacity protein-like surface antigen
MMMKKLIIVCATAVCGLTTPLAADFNCCAPQYDPCCCGADFNGFYVGGNLGVISHTVHRNDLNGFFSVGDVAPTNFSSVRNSFEAGVQVGYDWQCNSTLFGVVADWNWVNNRHRSEFSPLGSTIITTIDGSHHHRHQWFTTIRGRFGVTVCDALVYVTGGAAVHRHRSNFTFVGDDLGTAVDLDFRHHRTRWGWAGGVGTEYMMGCNWSFGAELLFLSFGNHTRRFTVPATGDVFRFGHSDTAWVLRFLVNYRLGDLFGGGCCW